jgi:thiosulfate/3-mercaptopyruvate sulfurtransferase
VSAAETAERDAERVSGDPTYAASSSVDVAPLVDVEWLAEHGAAPGIVALQVDVDSSAYYTAHLPGAIPLDWHDELHERVRRGPVSQAHFEELMRRKGIGVDDHVIFCGTGDSSHAAHAYWVFRYYQHRRLSLLDGGLRAWTLGGGRLEEAVPPPLVGTRGYRSPGPDPSVRVRRVEMVNHYAAAPPGAVVLDCRTPQEYAGAYRHPLDLGIEHHRVGGHVPGARSLPSEELLTEDGRFRPIPSLRELFARRGVREDLEVVVYCRVAERSSLLWFALDELLGHPRVRHYDGGWAEYGSLLDVPVERDR